MLDLLGSGYVIDHVVAEYNCREKEEAFRIYVADALKYLAESWGASVTYRYKDIVEVPEEQTVSGDEVALEVINKLGLKVNVNGLHETESDSVA